jgi:hypothetical protein
MKYRFLRILVNMVNDFESATWYSTDQCMVSLSVADPDSVGSGSFWSDPDADVWDRIRIQILALISNPISIFL